MYLPASPGIASSTLRGDGGGSASLRREGESHIAPQSHSLSGNTAVEGTAKRVLHQGCRVGPTTVGPVSKAASNTG